MSNEVKSSGSRIWLVLWLIVSQLGAGVLAVIPFIAFGVVALLTAGGGGFLPSLFALTCLTVALPLVFTVFAWVMFARRKDRAAAIVSGLALLSSAVMYGIVEYYSAQMG